MGAFITLIVLGVIIYLFGKGFIKGIGILFSYIIEPVTEGDVVAEITEVSDEDIFNDSNEPQEIILREPKFKSDKIKSYEQEVKQFEFRPQTWEQFIGQTDAKDIAKTIMKKAKRGMRAHLILSAIRGHGKTTYVKLLAKSLHAHLITRVGKQVDEEELENIVNEINESKAPFVIFFLDEIDTTDWKVIKILNPLIEEFEVSGKKIRPFIFASATINKDILIKNNPDTLDRIPHHIQFTRYSSTEISNIISQYKEQLYEIEDISGENIMTISESCKYNPRTAISLLESLIVEENINKVLRSNKIIKKGLTEVDINILKVLSEAPRPMGANAVALRVGLSPNQYVREFEPFLYEFGYLARVPSRIITDKGKELLKEIKHEDKS